MTKTNKSDLGLKAYVRTDQFFHTPLSIKMDWWLATAVLEALRSLYIFARGVEFRLIPFASVLPILLTVTLLLRSKIFFWIGFTLSVLSLLQVFITLRTYFGTSSPLHYEAVVLEVVRFIFYLMLFRQLRKGKSIEKRK